MYLCGLVVFSRNWIVDLETFFTVSWSVLDFWKSPQNTSPFSEIKHNRYKFTLSLFLLNLVSFIPRFQYLRPWQYNQNFSVCAALSFDYFLTLFHRIFHFGFSLSFKFWKKIFTTKFLHNLQIRTIFIPGLLAGQWFGGAFNRTYFLTSRRPEKDFVRLRLRSKV